MTCASLRCATTSIYQGIRSALDTAPAGHLGGDAAVEHVLEAGTAMRAHHDEISPTLVRHAYDSVRRGPVATSTSTRRRSHGA